MARIRSITRGTQSVRPHDTEVDCFYNVVYADDETPLLHLTTFGSDYRKSKPKSSQSIQIDESTARQLIDLMQATFPRLRSGPAG
jgi:5-methylcytosine-specific restriction protein B